MEKIKFIYEWLKVQPIWIKSVAIVIILAAFVIVFFSSCNTLKGLPDISNNNVGAEGVVSKEKNVTKQTKWYFKPDSINDQNSD